MRLLRASEVAERLAIPASWLMQAAREDRVPHYRLGRYVRFAEEEVATWLETQKRSPRGA